MCRAARPIWPRRWPAAPNHAGCVLVAHDPEVCSEVTDDVDLTLCGHTHGAQVRVAGIGTLVQRSRFAQRFTRGWTRQRGLGYVSRGLGIGVVPIRLNVPAELTLVTLVPSATSVAERRAAAQGRRAASRRSKAARSVAYQLAR